jgi:hypothetical protein
MSRENKIISMLLLAYDIPFITSLFYWMSIWDYLNNLPDPQKIIYAFLIAIYLLCSLFIILIGIPFTVDYFCNKEGA